MASAHTLLYSASTAMLSAQPTLHYVRSVWQRLQNSAYWQMNWSEDLLLVRCRDQMQTLAFADLLNPHSTPSPLRAFLSKATSPLLYIGFT